MGTVNGTSRAWSFVAGTVSLDQFAAVPQALSPPPPSQVRVTPQAEVASARSEKPTHAKRGMVYMLASLVVCLTAGAASVRFPKTPESSVLSMAI